MPTLVLSMIVKNAEATLVRCLDSVRGIVDEIVVADTGSTDRSREIAAAYGARVFSIAWENDFAKARNLSLNQVRSDWVLALDADEALDPDAGKLIPALLADPTLMGYMVQIRNYLLELKCHLWDQQAIPNTSAPAFAREYPAYVQHENVRLFRRHPEVYFAGRVHETVGIRILDLGMKIAPANFLIHHFGFIADNEALARKYLFYRELGREKLRDRPEDAHAHFELGIEEFEHFHNYEAALKLFERACDLNPRLGVAWLFYGMALARTGKYKEALEAFDRAEATGAKKNPVLEGKGDAYYSMGNFDSARRCYREVLRRTGDSPEVESKLGFTEVRLERSQEGLARLRRAVEREPGIGDLHDRLIAACAWLGRLEEAAEAAVNKLAAIDPQPDHFLRAASLHAQLKDWPRAIDLLRQGLDRFPDAEKLREAVTEAERQAVLEETEAKGDEQYQRNDFESARRCYQEALERLGEVPALESKLGLTEVRLGNAQEGLARLRHALERQPKSAELYDRLIGACVLLGRLGEAADAAELKLALADPPPDSFLRAASLRAQLQDWPRVIRLLHRGLELFPDAEKLRTALTEIEKHVPSAAFK